MIVHGASSGTDADDTIDQWIVVHVGSSASDALLHLSDPLVTVLGIAAVVVIALARRRFSGALLGIVVPAIAIGSAEYVLKPIIHRTNGLVPNDLDVHSLAYPSGHETGVVSWESVAALLLLSSSASRRVRAVLTTVLVLYAAAAGIGLVGAFHHYMTDVVGAICWAIAVCVSTALGLDAMREPLGVRSRRAASP